MAPATTATPTRKLAVGPDEAADLALSRLLETNSERIHSDGQSYNQAEVSRQRPGKSQVTPQRIPLGPVAAFAAGHACRSDLPTGGLPVVRPPGGRGSGLWRWARRPRQVSAWSAPWIARGCPDCGSARNMIIFGSDDRAIPSRLPRRSVSGRFEETHAIDHDTIHHQPIGMVKGPSLLGIPTTAPRRKES